MLQVTPSIVIPEAELSERFVHGSGPGGQNINKVATAVQLRFAVNESRVLGEPIKRRLARIAGSRLTSDGVLVITARRFRTQEANRRDARTRLATLIRQAAQPPRRRRPTRPSTAAHERRLQHKARRGQVKRWRRRAAELDE